MNDLRLDPETNDLDIVNHSFQLTTDFDDALIQKLRIKLKLFLGEWYLNTEKGVPYFEKILVKNPDLFEIAVIYKVKILETDGVEELTSFEVNFDEGLREYKLNFTIISTQGSELDVTVEA